ncbi:galactose-6-phosphate isomerase [Mycoplasmoides fastidiosum]|uniref:Galactose-6-phosphate isomerase n=1 Tax=Mycoplasmoides fastidiosum TaxID=92758 RepID=A0ABU0LYV5_9BACT|nr:RpiB/LacA/LacB family sugar-phosphate isomerase [Mycoplasmoides fastidiosum]MDQ0513857.1 galactose-6-phosphate isomerase [Mycoplasmoides fastidiosum]UUD37729.1 RpiB/LacA/LacB family sugar-phosphate isomerase [Mycoplasmoides fastidiosum]
MKIAIGCDHIVTPIKNKIVEKLVEAHHEVYDCGTHDLERTHYPLYGHAVSTLVAQQKVDYGIVICGTGVGIANSCNKVKNIRCVLTKTPLIAQQARTQYDANVLAMGGEIINFGLMWTIIQNFINTKFNQENSGIIDKINGKISFENYQTDLLAEQLQKWNCGCYEDDQKTVDDEPIHYLQLPEIKVFKK